MKFSLPPVAALLAAVSVFSGALHAQGTCSWSSLGGQSALGPQALVSWDDGSGPALYAGGSFTMSNIGANRVARWDGSSWSALGAGVGSNQTQVLTMSVYDDGSVPLSYSGNVQGRVRTALPRFKNTDFRHLLSAYTSLGLSRAGRAASVGSHPLFAPFRDCFSIIHGSHVCNQPHNLLPRVSGPSRGYRRSDPSLHRGCAGLLVHLWRCPGPGIRRMECE